MIYSNIIIKNFLKKKKISHLFESSIQTEKKNAFINFYFIYNYIQINNKCKINKGLIFF